MTTRAELRASLRFRLEDPNAGGLFSDADLNEAIAAAILAYAARVPRHISAALAVVAGQRDYALPADCLRIDAVYDADSHQLSPGGGEGLSRSVWATAITWSVWDRTLTLDPAPRASSASWRIRYVATRTPIAADAGDQPIEPGDAVIVAALAEAAAWGRRAAHETKRGLQAMAQRREQSAEREADRLISARTRVARGGVMA